MRDSAKIFGEDWAKGLLDQDPAEIVKRVKASWQLQQDTRRGASGVTTNRSKNPGGFTTT